MKKRIINIPSFQLLSKVKIESLNIIGTIVDISSERNGINYYIIEQTLEDGSGKLHYSIKGNDLTLI